MLRQRLMTAVVGIPLVLAAWLAGPVGLTALAAIIGAGAVWEAAALLARTRLTGACLPGVVFVGAAQAAAWSMPPERAAAAAAGALAVSWLVVVAALILRTRAADDDAPASVFFRAAGSLLAAFWIAWPLALWPALYRLGAEGGRAEGLALSMLPLAVTWLSDTAAYFAGVRWGRRKLAPALSPRKSLEGALAGLAVGAGTGAVVSSWLPWSAPAGAAAGLFISAAAQVGDLWESAVKRTAGAKDSGRLLPGHGGILDRFDAMLLALPAAYLAGWLGLAR